MNCCLVVKQKDHSMTIQLKLIAHQTLKKKLNLKKRV